MKSTNLKIMTPAENNQEKINQTILGEGSLKELKPFFPNREAILKYHAQRMVELFPPDRKIAECECCNRRSAELRVAFLWRGIFHTAGTVIGTIIGIAAVLGGHGILPSRRIDFTTTHGLCDGCFKQMRFQKMLGELGEKLCFIFIVLSAIVFAMVLVMTPVLLLSRPTSREIAVMVVGLGGGLICLIGGLLAANKVVRWYIPKSLKFISKQPFQLLGFKKL
jgi:hypothetical protein